MIRMQVQLTPEQADELRRAAAARHTSIAAIVREAVDRELDRGGTRRAARQRALNAIEGFRGGASDVSVAHDRYLDEAWGL